MHVEHLPRLIGRAAHQAVMLNLFQHPPGRHG
jgi:hypothetical protein